MVCFRVHQNWKYNSQRQKVLFTSKESAYVCACEISIMFINFVIYSVIIPSGIYTYTVHSISVLCTQRKQLQLVCSLILTLPLVSSTQLAVYIFPLTLLPTVSCLHYTRGAGLSLVSKGAHNLPSFHLPS